MSAVTIRPAATLRPCRRRALPKSLHPAARSGPQLAEAMARYQESLRCKAAQGDALGVAACYLEIGDLYLSCGEAERAGEMYRRSLAISRGAGHAAPRSAGTRSAL